MIKENINIEHSASFAVIKDGITKRYEITADDGYIICEKESGDFFYGTLIIPAKKSVEEIIKTYTMKIAS